MASPSRLTRPLAGLALAFLLGIADAHAQATGLAILAAGKQKTIYLAKDGKLWRAPLSGESQVITAEGLQPVKTRVEFPLELAAFGDQLLITDGILSYIFRYDPASGETGEALHVGSLGNLSKLAVADSGEVASYDANNLQLRLHASQRSNKAGVQLETGGKPIGVPDASGLAYNGNVLFLLQGSNLLTVDEAARRNSGKSTARATLAPAARFPRDLAARSIAAAGGALYVLHSRGVAVVTQPDFRLLPVIHHAAPGHRLLAVDPDVVATYTDQTGWIHVTKRAQQATLFEVEGTGEELEAGILGVYKYLEEINPATRLSLTTESGQSDIASWLIDQRLVPADLTLAGQKAVATHFCSLNPGFCPNATTEALGRPLPPGTTVAFTRVPSEVGSVFREQAIDTSIRDFVEKLPPRFQPTAQVLSEENVSRIGGIDSTLTKAGMLIAAPQSEELRPGDIITFDGGREVRISSLSDCVGTGFRAMPPRPGPFIPRGATTAVGVDAIPVDRWILQRRREQIDRVRIDYRGLTLQGFAVENPNAAADCFHRLTSNIARNVAVVLEVLRAEGATVSMFGYKGEPISLTKEERAALGLEDASDGAIRIAFPFTVAFRPARPTESDPISFETPRDFLQLKPDLRQNPFKLAKGTYFLPRYTWRMWGLIPRSEFDSDKTKLAMLVKEHPRIYPLPLTTLGSRPQSNHEPDPSAQALTNRAELHKAISFRPYLRAGTTRPVIGIIENDKDLKEHDAFVEGNESMWVEDVDRVFKRKSATPRPPTPRKVRDAIPTKDVHASHVAGIIASADKAMPAFLQSADLFLLNTKDGLPELNQKIEGVATRIKVLNYSQVDDSKNTYTGLKTKIIREWPAKVLFVVAAGNSETRGGLDGANLDEAGASLALISWVRDAPQNIIGVAATNLEGDFIRQCADDKRQPNRKVGCSNYGLKYVQIAAPGHQIISATELADYAPASGTSVAAPQVTATAVLILQRVPSLTPARLKARLISTADFDARYEDKVAGGKLNMLRAIVGSDIPPDHAVVVTREDPPNTYLVRFPSDWQLKIKDGQGYSGNNSKPPSAVPGNSLLRLQFNPALQKYWMAYLKADGSNGEFQLAKQVEPAVQDLPILSMQQFNERTGEFAPLSTHAWLINKAVPITDLSDFVSSIPPFDPKFP